MMKIFLKNLRFLGNHGMHDEETLMGNVFELNVEVGFIVSKNISSISDTINYVTIFETIKKRMEKPERLLETLAMSIADEIFIIDERINYTTVSINKFNPPIKNFSGSIEVKYLKER